MSLKNTFKITGLLAMSLVLINPLSAETQPQAKPLHFKMPTATVESFSGEAVRPLLPQMTESVNEFFKGYPYLYSAPKDQVIGPAEYMFVNDKESLVVSIKKDGKWVGVAAGLPLSSSYLNNDYFSENMAEKVRVKGFDPDKIFYMAYFLVPADLRHDQKLISDIYSTFVSYAKSLGKTQMCYMEEVVKEEKLVLKPSSYVAPEAWDLLPAFTSMDITNETSWSTFQLDGSVQRENHSLLFLINDL